MAKQKVEPGALGVGPSSLRHSILAAFLVILAAGIVYTNTLKHPYLWDDDTQIQKKFYLSDMAGIKKLWTRDYYEMTDEESYRPIDTLSLFAVHSVFGESSLPQRLCTLLLHCLNAFLVLSLLRRWLPLFPSLCGALVFAVHPIHTEVLNCVSYRDELLACFFILSGFLLYVRQRPKAALIVYGLGLLSKENAIVLPLLIGGYEWLLGPMRTSLRENIKAVFQSRFAQGLVVVTVGYLYVRFSLLPNVQLKAIYPGGTLLSNIYTMGPALVNYFSLLIWPYPLAVSYDIPILSSPFNGRFFMFVIFTAGLVSTFLFFWKRERRAAFFLLWIIAPLLPVLNFIPFLNVSLMYERYLYLPSVGIAGLWAVLIFLLPKKIGFVIPALLIPAYSFGTWSRNQDWSSGEKLYAENVRVFPNNYSVYVFLGEAYLKLGQFNRASDQFEKSLALKPGYPPGLNALGVAQNKKGEFEAALANFRAAMRERPNFDSAKESLSDTLFQMGRSTEALHFVQTEIEQNPQKVWAHKNLAIFYNLMAKPIEERACLERALRQGLYWPGAHSQLGAVLFHSGLVIEAIKEFEEELKRNPGDSETHSNLGIAYFKTNRNEQALAALHEALALDPSNGPAHSALVLVESATRK